MSLLTLIQNSCDSIGLSRPSVVTGSQDQNVRTLLSLAQTEGRELLDRFSWPATQIEKTHTSLAAELQGVMTTLAPGFSYITSSTFWDRSSVVSSTPTQRLLRAIHGCLNINQPISANPVLGPINRHGLLIPMLAFLTRILWN